MSTSLGKSQNGGGILSFLYTAKNQEESSPHRQSLNAILEAFHIITEGFEFETFIKAEISPDPGPPSFGPPTVEMKFRRGTSAWIQADDCGLGFQDLLIVLYFALASDFELVLIEEPENHLHPDIQRRLLAYLREKSERQFLLSTHSSIFLNTAFVDRVFTCKMSDGVQVQNATSRAVLLTELGYSIADNLVTDIIVLCEGPTDKSVLEELFSKVDGLRRRRVKIWPLGGDIMDQLDLSVFQEAHKVIALIDRDPGSSHVRSRFRRRCEDLNIPVTQLERYSLENYFTLRAIETVMKGQMPREIAVISPDKPVSEQLGFDVKKNGRKIAKHMSLEEIHGTDLYTFLTAVENLDSRD